MPIARSPYRSLAGLGALVLIAMAIIALRDSPDRAATVAAAPSQSTAAGPSAAGPISRDDPIGTASAVAITSQRQLGLQTDQVRWEPEVIFNDGVETTRLEVRLVNNFNAVFISTAGVLDRDAVVPPDAGAFATDLIRLFDDGSNGDRVAGDGVYSRSGITASGALQHDGGTHQTLRTNLFFTFADGGVLARSMETGVSVVDISQRGRITVTDIGGGRFATSHALFIVDDGTIFPGYPAINAKAARDVCLACQALIEEVGDVFDFIVINTAELTDFEARDQNVLAIFSQRKNDIDGIGKDLFNTNGGPRSLPGGGALNTFSADRLRGIVFNNQVDGGPLQHEIMHNWAFELGGALPYLDGTGHYIGRTDILGLMDVGSTPLLPTLEFSADAPFGIPADLLRNADGTYRLVPRLGPNYTEFSPIALYVAGILPPSQVPDINVFGAVDRTDEDRVRVTIVSTTGIDAVIAANGERSPTNATSPKDFTAGAVVVKDRPFSEAEFAYLTLMMRYFGSDQPYDGFGPVPWNAATRGISTMTTALPGFEEPVSTLGDAASAPLADGWTLIGTTEDQSVQTALDAIAGPAGPIFTWNPFRQAFRAFNPALPGQLNTLSSFQRGEGVWVFSPGGGAWTQRPFTEARSVPLSQGFNLVMWSGASGTPMADAVAGLGADFEVLFTWDTTAQTFLSFNADVPPAFNTAATLTRGEGVWIRVTRATTWDQPAP